MTLKKLQRFVHVITHGPRCLDGVAAAVAVARYSHDAVVIPNFCSHRHINDALASLRCDPAEADHEVWITDISWSDPDVDRHLETLIDRGVRVYWIDHHRTALTRLNEGLISVHLTACIVSEAHAASRLVFEYLRRRGDAASASEWFLALQPLIAMADDNDRWLHRIPGSRELAATVNAMEDADAYDELLNIDAGVTYSARMLTAQQRARDELAQSFAIAERSRVDRPVAGTDLTLVTAVCAGYSSEIADAWGRTSSRTLFAFFDAKSVTVSLRRSRDCDFDLSGLAAQLGGGGHAAAAGCEPRELHRQVAETVSALIVQVLTSPPVRPRDPAAR